jgi:hypothetical protein
MKRGTWEVRGDPRYRRHAGSGVTYHDQNGRLREDRSFSAYLRIDDTANHALSVTVERDSFQCGKNPRFNAYVGTFLASLIEGSGRTPREAVAQIVKRIPFTMQDLRRLEIILQRKPVPRREKRRRS